MELELFGLTGVLVCSAHLCLGYVGGRLSRERVIEPASRPKPPFYLDDMLELIERSQRLRQAFEPHQREVPIGMTPALLQVLEAAEALQRRVAGNSLQCRAPAALNTIPRSPGIPSHVGQSSSSLSKSEFISLALDAECATADSKLGNNRRPYTTRQNIAFYSEGLPKAHEFEQVQCLDLSVDGVSFLLNREPEEEHLVITLGSPPNLIFMTAKVVNKRIVFKDGREGYRVGCQFLKRIEPPRYHWNLELGIIEPLVATSLAHQQE